MLYAIAYAAILLPFRLLDGVWLSVMGSLLYRPTLGNILLPSLNAPPAVAFYLVYPTGILFFATLPALKAESISLAFIFGALFGALAYAPYDLTNFANRNGADPCSSSRPSLAATRKSKAHRPQRAIRWNTGMKKATAHHLELTADLNQAQTLVIEVVKPPHVV